MGHIELRFTQVNLGHRRSIYCDLKLCTKNKQVDIDVIQETLCNYNKHLKIPRYEFAGNKNFACFIKKGILYDVKSLKSEYMIVELLSYTIINTYRSPNKLITYALAPLSPKFQH